VSDIVAVSSLTEALAVLHRAGRIRTPWLGGMRIVGKYPEYPIRIHDFGERVLDAEDMVSPDQPWRWWSEPQTSNGGPCPGPYVPDLADPATRGCLAALAREAVGDPTLTVETVLTAARGIVWMASTPRAILGPERPTEGEAWAAVLIAAAERCTTEVGT
jgi:hypothetical protein